MTASDGEIREAIRRYFPLLQSDPTADDMRAEAVTDDFPHRDAERR